MGKKSEFLPLRNRLMDAMKEDAKAKYKNYPRLVEDMKKKYKEDDYEQKRAISHLLKEHEEFLITYLNTLFPYRKRGIEIVEVKAPSKLDYIITVRYHYKESEMDVIRKILKKKDWPKDPDPEKIGKFLMLYCLQSYAMPIQEVFQGPFAFMPTKIKAEAQDDGTLITTIKVQGREQ